MGIILVWIGESSLETQFWDDFEIFQQEDYTVAQVCDGQFLKLTFRSVLVLILCPNGLSFDYRSNLVPFVLKLISSLRGEESDSKRKKRPQATPHGLPLLPFPLRRPWRRLSGDRRRLQ